MEYDNNNNFLKLFGIYLFTGPTGIALCSPLRITIAFVCINCTRGVVNNNGIPDIIITAAGFWHGRWKKKLSFLYSSLYTMYTLYTRTIQFIRVHLLLKKKKLDRVNRRKW